MRRTILICFTSFAVKITTLHDPSTRNASPAPAPIGTCRRRASPTTLPPLGNRAPSRGSGALALPRRCRLPLYSRLCAPGSPARRSLALDSPPEVQSRPTRRQHRSPQKRERQSRFLARPPLATPRPDDRGLRRRHRFLV